MIHVNYIYMEQGSRHIDQFTNPETSELVRIMQSWLPPGPGRLDLLRGETLLSLYLHRAGEWYVDLRTGAAAQWVSSVIQAADLGEVLEAFRSDGDVLSVMARGRSYYPRSFDPERDGDYQGMVKRLRSGQI